MQRHAKEAHRMEDKAHKCPQCLKSFPSTQQLAQHSLVHTNVRKYPCNYCDKAFKQLSHVQQHQRIHTGLWYSLHGNCPNKTVHPVSGLILFHIPENNSIEHRTARRTIIRAGGMIFARIASILTRFGADRKQLVASCPVWLLRKSVCVRL